MREQLQGLVSAFSGRWPIHFDTRNVFCTTFYWHVWRIGVPRLEVCYCRELSVARLGRSDPRWQSGVVQITLHDSTVTMGRADTTSVHKWWWKYRRYHHQRRCGRKRSADHSAGPAVPAWMLGRRDAPRPSVLKRYARPDGNRFLMSSAPGRGCAVAQAYVGCRAVRPRIEGLVGPIFRHRLDPIAVPCWSIPARAMELMTAISDHRRGNRLIDLGGRRPSTKMAPPIPTLTVPERKKPCLWVA